jgi:uridine phosphorylase
VELSILVTLDQFSYLKDKIPAKEKMTGKDKGIICPVKGHWEPNVGPDALMVMIPSELQYIVRKAKAEKVPFNDKDFYQLYQAKDGIGSPLSISGPFLGAPHAVIALEKLIVLGAKRVWVLGWCGSLQRELPVGHLLIPTGAVSEEGTSCHYPLGERSCQSDPALNHMLAAALKERGASFSKGEVWTTDALYRETPEKVKTYQARGILAVEMEFSALMTVALYRSVALAGLLVVSDELFDLKWRPGFSNPLLKRASREAGTVLLKLAVSLSQDVASGPEPSPTGGR